LRPLFIGVSKLTYIAALSNNLGNILTSWLYAGIVEGSSNATAAPWTNDEWVFAPVNSTLSSDPLSMFTQRNVTLDTAALRGRLQCTPIDMSNSTEWLVTLDFKNKTLWNDTKIPSGINVGYELHNTFPGQYDDTNTIPFFPDGNRLTCCSNETGGDVGKAAIGYWTSAVRGEGVMIKWITGYPFKHQFTTSVRGYSSGKAHWIWKDIPSVTAMNCTPVFESANANVKVDLSSGIVQEHKILDTPVNDTSAFQYNYVTMNVSAGLPYSFSNTGHGMGYLSEGGAAGEYLLNMTTR